MYRERLMKPLKCKLCLVMTIFQFPWGHFPVFPFCSKKKEKSYFCAVKKSAFFFCSPIDFLEFFSFTCFSYAKQCCSCCSFLWFCSVLSCCCFASFKKSPTKTQSQTKPKQSSTTTRSCRHYA